MSSSHTITILATGDIATNVRLGLQQMAEPFNVSLVVDHQIRDVEKTVYGKVRGSGHQGHQEVKVVQRNIEAITEERSIVLPEFSSPSNEDVHEIVGLLLNEQMNAVSSFLPTFDPVPEIAALLNRIPLEDVSENHLIVANYFMTVPEIDEAAIQVNGILAAVIEQPWRDWSLYRQRDLYILVGGKDHRIDEWEKANDVVDSSTETSIDIKELRSYLRTHYAAFVPRFTPMYDAVIDAAIRTALAGMLRDHHVVRKPRDTLLVNEHKEAYLKIALPVIKLVCEQTLEPALPKALSCYNTIDVQNNQLIVSADYSQAKYQTERERLLSELDNQDYVPERMRQHYHL